MTANNADVRHLLPLRNFAYWIVLSVAMLIAASMPAFAAKFSFGGGSAKPLTVELAYPATVKATNRQIITVTFDIADEYYLYRDKTAVVINTPGASSTAPEFPEAIIFEDEYFGETAIFRGRTTFTVPLTVEDSVNSVDLTLKFQGCADMGLCYPPTEYPLEVELPNTVLTKTSKKTDAFNNLLIDRSSPASQSQATTPVKSKSKINLDLFENNQAPILPPEQAFIPTATVNGDTVTVSWFIEPEYYLYRDKMKFSFADDAAAITNTSHSESQIESDEFFGDVAVFRHQAINTLSTNAANDGAATLDILYQGCADIGVCFPPTKVSLPLELVKSELVKTMSSSSSTTTGTAVTAATATATAAATDASATNTQAKNNSSAPQTEQDRIRAKLSSSSLWINALSFFVLGLLLSFTPCVFPMIPILSSLILGQGKSLSTGKAFGLSLTYVLAMAVTYTLVGVFIGLSGYNLQAWFQNPWILSVFALIFVLLSLSMFGFYEIQMPQSVQTKLSNWSNKQEGGNWIGVGIMGMLSALIVGPCVTAPLVGALIYIAETGDATVGGVALFSMSMGMGLPLLIIGTSAGKLMPKAGAWMDVTKVLFGLSMLASALCPVALP